MSKLVHVETNDGYSSYVFGPNVEYVRIIGHLENIQGVDPPGGPIYYLGGEFPPYGTLTEIQYSKLKPIKLIFYDSRPIKDC